MNQYKNLCEYPFEALASGTEPIAIDTETLGATRELNLPIYYSWAAKDFGSGAAPTTTKEGWRFLEALSASPRPKVFHNAKFDLTVLEKVGLKVQGEIHDTILQHLLLDEHHLEHHRLKALSRELLGRTRMDEFELKRVQKKGKAVNLGVPQGPLHKYARMDAEDTLDLYYLFTPMLKEQGLWDLYRQEVEVEMVYKLLDETGIAIDTEFVEDAIKEMEQALRALETQIYKAFGETFLISSPQQLGGVLSKHFPLRERTPSGNYKTDKATLQNFIQDPKIQMIFAWKFLAKACSTARGYKKREVNGRIHPDYRQTTKTGRCNCHNPNLTTIPKQRGRITEVEVGSPELAATCSEAFRKVRRVFIAPPGAILVAWDYSQIEYRAFVHYTGSKRLIESLKAGEDFHTVICEMVFDKVDKRLRHITKIVNYGILYGMGKAYLQQMLQVEGVNTRNILARYEANFPEMRHTQRLMEETARSRGYITDVFGRRYRYVPEWGYKIVSWICQGTAANVKKTSMLRTNKIYSGRKSRLVLDIHDDLTFEVYPEDLDLLHATKRAMEEYPQFDVPLVVKCSVGHNLLEMNDVEITEQNNHLQNLF